MLIIHFLVDLGSMIEISFIMVIPTLALLNWIAKD